MRGLEDEKDNRMNYIMKHTMIWVAAMMLAMTSAVSAQENENANEGQFVRCIAF